MRERLIETAIDIFGAKGLDGASTREIASAADTSMSMITYHFGGKEGLYLAAADHIFTVMESQLRTQDMSAPGDAASNEERIDYVRQMVRAAARFMLSEPSARYAQFIVREQVSPVPAVQDIARQHVGPIIGGLAGQLTALRPTMSSDDARATAFLLFGMAVHLRLSRPRLLDAFNVTDVSPDLHDRLLTQVDEIVRSTLEALE